MTQSKVTRSKYDFSDCKDAEKLRKVLNGATKEIVEDIARTFKEIQLPAKGKRITKKELVDAIVGLYFPNATVITKTATQLIKEEVTMKKTLKEVRAELEGCTVEMLRDIVRKDSRVKGVSRMRRAELLDAATLVIAKLNPEVVEAPCADAKPVKTEKPTKLTAADIADALSKAETESAMLEVLMQGKRADMVAALSIATNGAKQTYPSKGNYETALCVARMFQDWRDAAKFRELSLDEKYDYLTSQTDQREIDKVFSSLTEAEFMEIAHRVRINPEDSHAERNTCTKLRGITDANFVKSLADAGEVEYLENALMYKVSLAGLRELCEQNGLDADENLALGSIPTREALIKHYEEKLSCAEEPVAVADAVNEAVRVIDTDAPCKEKYAALLKCTDAEMFSVMRASTGGSCKQGEDYKSHEDLACKVLCRIEERRRELRMPPKVKPHDELTVMTLPALRKYVRTLIVSKTVPAYDFRGYTMPCCGKDEILRKLDRARIEQEATDAYYRHKAEEDVYQAKYAAVRVRFEEGAAYECASGKYTVIKRMSSWVKLMKEGAERSLSPMRVDVMDGVEVLELEPDVILRADPAPETKPNAELLRQCSAYEIGHRIVELRGKPKVQREVLEHCNKNFMLMMEVVFGCWEKLRNATDEEVLQYFCRTVLLAARDSAMATSYLGNMKPELWKGEHIPGYFSVEQLEYLRGWEKFLEEYAKAS